MLRILWYIIEYRMRNKFKNRASDPYNMDLARTRTKLSRLL